MPSPLYHFSEDPGIEVFTPRLMPRRPEIADPLVWAVDDEYAFTYLFPRDCPRILLWPLPGTTAEDRERWFSRSDAHALAHVEYAWFDRLRTACLYRYTLPVDLFEPLGPDSGPGNYVSRSAVVPTAMVAVPDLIEALRTARVELRVLDRLTPLRGLWETTTLHWSGYRLGFAQDW